MTSPPTATELTIADAAERYGVNRRSLQRAVERGKIPSRMFANMYLVDPEAVRLYAEIVKARHALATYTGTAADDE
jgi:excisionase family DNA binding protein